MKKEQIFRSVIFMLSVFFLSATASFAGVINPNPALWHDDDDTEIFTPNALVVNFEIWDAGDLAATANSEFGFFFAGTDPTNALNRVTIFGTEDSYSLALAEYAAINFTTGIVRDLSNLVPAQDTFTPGINNIGFYYTINNLTIYTTEADNYLGSDVGTFRSILNPGVYRIDFTTPLLEQNRVAVELVAGVQPVPLPAAIFLLGSGLAGLVPAVRRNRG
jgi:hypothetical protein